MMDRADTAARPPKTERWSAHENEHHESTVMLLVSGVVQVSSTNRDPRLTEAASGPNGALILDLSIETADHPGTDVLVWKQANFSRRVRENEFREVRIRWAGTPIARCKVLDDDQTHAQLALHTQAANEKASVTAKVKAAPGWAGEASDKAKAVMEAVGDAVSGRVGRAVGAAVVAAAGAAAVAGAASRLMAPAAKKSKSNTAAKAKAKTKAKSKTKAKAKTKAKKATKTKASPKTKTMPKKAAKKTAKKTTKKTAKKTAKKMTRRATKKTRNVKSSRSAGKRSTKKRSTKK